MVILLRRGGQSRPTQAASSSAPEPVHGGRRGPQGSLGWPAFDQYGPKEMLSPLTFSEYWEVGSVGRWPSRPRSGAQFFRKRQLPLADRFRLSLINARETASPGPAARPDRCIPTPYSHYYYLAFLLPWVS